jgi:NhaP-type Na+/H+ or K+/H+ antiporter
LAKAWRHIVVLGGVCGAISGALVASLPESNLKDTIATNLKDTIATITFGIVLSSLIIQYIGLTSMLTWFFQEKKKAIILLVTIIQRLRFENMPR